MSVYVNTEILPSNEGFLSLPLNIVSLVVVIRSRSRVVSPVPLITPRLLLTFSRSGPTAGATNPEAVPTPLFALRPLGLPLLCPVVSVVISRRTRVALPRATARATAARATPAPLSRATSLRMSAAELGHRLAFPELKGSLSFTSRF